LSDKNYGIFSLKGSGREINLKKVNKIIKSQGDNERYIIEDGLKVDNNRIIIDGYSSETWRYDYSEEVVQLLKKLEKELNFNFKGKFKWVTEDYAHVTTSLYIFNGRGNCKKHIGIMENED